MLSNPDLTLGECAKSFGYTQSWLSTIIHSDAFQAEFRRRRGQLDEHFALGIHRKMAEVSKKALDKLEGFLATAEADADPRLVLDIADKTLHRQGYAPSKGNVLVQQNNTTINNNGVDRGVLENARNLMRSINGEATEVPALEHSNAAGEK